MIEHPQRALFLLGLACSAACGPSAAQVRLQNEHRELGQALKEQQQYNADLKQRMKLVEARNRVLIDLVQGLTSSTASAAQPASHAVVLGPAQKSLVALDQDLAQLVTSVQHSQQDVAAMRAQRETLEADLGLARQTIERTRAEEAQAKARSDAYEAMLVRLSALIAERNLDVRIVDNRMLLTLPEAVLFESNDARVRRSGKALLDRIAEVLLAVPGREFQVAGHTDSQPIRYGRYHDNWRLSSERALNVMLYLIERGVPKSRLSASAYADTRPITQAATPAAQRSNRRIEIALLPKLDELPDLSLLQDLLSKTQTEAHAEAPPALPVQ